MKIAFVTIGDTRDVQRGSGTPYHLWQELIKQGNVVHLVGPLNVNAPPLTRFFKYASRKLGKRYSSHRDPFFGKALGKMAERALANLDYDILLTNDYCLAGYTQTSKPIVLYTDAFFPYHYAENVHPWLANLSRIGVYFYQRTTEQGLRRADKCIFASQYAMEEAQKYPAAKNKVFSVIPYGANIDAPAAAPKRSIESIRAKGKFDLLFVGKYWELKGGPMAVRIAEMLNKRGVASDLHVVGVDQSAQYPQKFVKFYGLLNKQIPAEKAKLEELYKTCDALIVPSKAEGYGLVFAEAAACGMPSLAYATTGVTTAVQHGGSGILFDPQEDEKTFARQVEEWLDNSEEYENLCRGAREFYETSANWKSAVKKLTAEMEKI
ncbi:MAG: glycosyltransferase family 4 protein [Anaerolineales bacterium]